MNWNFYNSFRELYEKCDSLEGLEYTRILNLIEGIMIGHPIPITFLPKNSFVTRVRKNLGKKYFSNLPDEISYIKDPKLLENMSEYGRANIPHQAMFYCSTDSDSFPSGSVTAIAETSQLFTDDSAINLEGEVYTVGEWKVLERLALAEICFSLEAIERNQRTRESFIRFRDMIVERPDDDQMLQIEFLYFISSLFGRRVNTHHDYKISAGFANLILSRPEINGIVYPSVRTQYEGFNVVLKPSVVDQCLELRSVYCKKLHKLYRKSYMNPYKVCVDHKQNPLVWREPETKHSDEMILEFLKAPLTSADYKKIKRDYKEDDHIFRKIFSIK